MNVAKDGFKDRHLENWEKVEENQNKIPKTAKEPPYTERYIRLSNDYILRFDCTVVREVGR